MKHPAGKAYTPGVGAFLNEEVLALKDLKLVKKEVKTALKTC
ncbi:hypothetical protein [Chitinophaga costaii]|nr:hypothetical protein [Chitinophaga costaii]